MKTHGFDPQRTTSLAVRIATLTTLTLLASSSARAQGSDNCATPQVISGLGPHAFNTTTATTGSQGQTVACSFSQGVDNDVWFRWTAPQNGTVALSTCQQTTVDTKIAVYGGTSCPVGSAIACSDDDCGVQSQTSFVTGTGVTYVFQIGSSPGNPGGTGTFTLTYLPPATNDNCATPAVITGPGPIPFDNSLASTGTQGQNNPGCVNVKNDLWYQWTAPATGIAHLSLCGQTAVDTAIAVYTGGTCPSAHSIACDDDACGLQSMTSFGVTAGAVFMLQIGSSGGASAGLGTFTIDVEATPANDDCGSPLTIGPGGVSFDTTSATTGSQGQSNPCGTIENDLWYAWTPSGTGTATIDTCGQTALNTSLAVYSGSGCPSGAALACNDDGCGQQSSVTFNIVAGTTYLIQVGSSPGSGGGPGSFIISTNAVGATPFCFGDGTAGPCPCNNAGIAGHGCQNSASTGGSVLTATGTSSLSADTLQFTASGELPVALSILLQGNLTISAISFGDGLRCTGGNLKRLYVKSASGGVVTAPVSGDLSVSARSAALGDTIPLGATRNYQFYYRDPNPTFCASPLGSTFNVSNAMAVVWGS
jgi:hypothetical protein